MTDRPILFSTPMVRALLAGTKTQTRRAVKPQPPQHTVAVGRWQDPPGYDAAWWAFVREGAVEKDHPFGGAEIHGDPWRCPCGKPGDRLWVKETVRLVPDQEPDDGTGRVLSVYAADGALTVADAWPWKRRQLNSIHCPRALSRITLEITGVRVERLQDISEADAIAEGIPSSEVSPPDMARFAYRQLWGSINGPGSWDANPWVWCVSFKRVTP